MTFDPDHLATFMHHDHWCRYVVIHGECTCGHDAAVDAILAQAAELATLRARVAPEGQRLHLAWLMWCFNQGYTNIEDRAILTNWLLDDPATLHREDAALRPHLLAMADEVLRAASTPDTGSET